MASIEKYIRKFSALREDRGVWESHWDECARWILPRKREFVQKDVVGGQKKFDEVYDDTAIRSNELFASSLHGMLVSPTAQWFQMETEDDNLNNDQDVIDWMDDTSERMLAAIMDPEAKFTSQLDEFFLDIGAFGTGLMRVAEGPGADNKPGPVVKFDAWNITQVYIAENSDNEVDAFYRLFKWKAWQVRDFMERNKPGSFASAPPGIIKAYKKSLPTQFEILHVVAPTDERGDDILQPVESVWIAYADKQEIWRSGFSEQSVFAARWRKTSWEVYGRGPGIHALADIKMMNEMKRNIIEATEKVLNPPLDVPHKAYIGRIRTAAKAINYRKPNRLNDRIEPLVTVGNLPITYELIDRVEAAIRSSFYNTQLQLAEGPNMTAFEVAQRQNEKLRLMAPMLGRIQAELFSPILGRVLRIMLRSNKLKAVPQILRERNPVFRPRYLSQLAQAQQSTDSDAIVTTMQIVGQLAQFDPNALAPFDMVESSKIVARAQGYPTEAMRSNQDTDNIQRTQAEQQLDEQRKNDVERVAGIIQQSGAGGATEAQ